MQILDPRLDPRHWDLVVVPEHDALRGDNVLVTRTFSKIYGLAGERVGWATGAAHLVDTLNRIRGPFNVTNHGQAAALAALGDQGFVSLSREHNATELARFSDAVNPAAR